MAIVLNAHYNRLRRAFGVGYWSLSAWAKYKVKNVVNFIGDYEAALAGEARRRGADGVVCGHIHHAAIKMIDGVRYVNTRDFVESCTAIAEHADGRSKSCAGRSRWPCPPRAARRFRKRRRRRDAAGPNNDARSWTARLGAHHASPCVIGPLLAAGQWPAVHLRPLPESV